MVKLSVIIPIYNAEPYIDQCIRSALDQSFNDYEVILIDDGSPDRCPEICDAYDAKYPNIHAYHKENGGLSSARNLGISKATGEYLFFLDSDDLLKDADTLKTIAGLLDRNHPDVLLFLPEELDHDLQEEVLSHSHGPWDEGVLYHAADVLDSVYAINGIWVTKAQTMLVKRDFCRSRNLWFYEGIFHEDDEWIANILLSDPTLVFSYHCFYTYRHTADSIIRTADPEKIYKKKCDKIIVASQMLSHPEAKKYPSYICYASLYLLNNIISAGQMSPENKDRFIEFLKPYRSCYRKILYSKDIKLIIKALFLILFRERLFISLYKRKINA